MCQDRGEFVLPSVSTEAGGRSSQKFVKKETVKPPVITLGSQRFESSVKLNATPVVVSGRLPCEATITLEKMESARA